MAGTHYLKLNEREKRIVDLLMNQHRLSRFEKILGFKLLKGEEFENIQEQLSIWILFSGAISRFEMG